MTRHVALALVVMVLGAAIPVSPALGAPADTDATVVQFGPGGQPSYVVEVTNGSLSTLRDWAASSDRRQVITADNTTNTATIAGPWYIVETVGPMDLLERPSLDAARSLLSTSLAAEKYVISVEPNVERTWVDPVDRLANASALERPAIGLLAADDPEYPTAGVATKGDANTTTMAESRAIIGADNVSETGANVTVAVIDTGVNTADGQIFGNGSLNSNIRVLASSKNFITNKTVAKAGLDAVEDGNGHGTWVASAIAANTSDATHDGVAPDAAILALKALADDGTGSTSHIAEAIRYAADHDADVISMSLGSPQYSPVLADAIEYAIDEGSVVVAAVGNSRQTTRWIGTPADVDGVIAVAATNGSEPPTAGSAYFSQLGEDPGTTDGSNGITAGETVTIAAPGMSTLARVATTGGYIENSTLSGTSMATPLVSGSVALALEAHSGWNVSTTHEWVTDAARPIPNAAVAEVGHGMIAADNLVDTAATNTSQNEAMDTAAADRDTFYQALSDASGGFLDTVVDGGGAISEVLGEWV